MKVKSLKKTNIFITVFFIFLLFLPILDLFFEFSPVKNLFEKREAAKFPKNPKNISEIEEYPPKFENYFNDNYGFRKSLISFNGLLMDKIFNESPDERALIGKDSWLYFDNKKSLLDAQSLAKINQEKIDKLVNSFINNYKNLKKHNIKYLLVIAADKTTIYPEFLPNYIKYSDKNHRIDKFLQALRQKSPNFPILDLRPILKEAKKKEIIFHKTDTHWNYRGSHYGYEAIMKKLGLKYNSRNQFINIKDKRHIGDISNIMGLNISNIDYSLKPKFKQKWRPQKISIKEKERFHKPIFFKNKDKNLPILFVYKDSFFDNMLFYFAQHFSESYFINEFPCNIDINILKQYKTDIFIQQFWENRIEDIANNCNLNGTI